MSALTRKLLADVTRRKGRTILMILGIMIGVLGVTAVTEASSLLGGGFLYSMDAGAVPNVLFLVDKLPPAQATLIQHQPSVQQFQQHTLYSTTWQDAGSPAQDRLQLLNTAEMQQSLLWPFQIASGRLPGRGEVLIDARDLSAYPTKIGDTISVEVPDGSMFPLRVVGIARTRGVSVWSGSADPVAYVSPDVLKQVTTGYTHQTGDTLLGTQILLKASDMQGIQIYNATLQALKSAQLKVILFQWHPLSGGMDAQLSVAGPLVVIQLLTWLSLLLVCVMLINAVNALLVEQIKIIGTMKALGGTRWPIMRSYLLTVSIYSVIGTLLGVVLGLLAGYQLTTYLALTVQNIMGAEAVLLDVGDFQIIPWVVIVGLGIGLVVPVLAALWPLFTGTRMTVREAIADYGVQGEADTHVRAWGRGMNWVPQTVWLGLRGLFRRRGRVALTLLALVLSGTIFQAVQITNDTLGSAINLALSPIFRPDIRVDLVHSDESVHAQPIIDAIHALPNVERIVPVSFQDTTTIAQNRIFLTGVPADKNIYQPTLVAGRWLHPHEQGAFVINEYAAQRLHLLVGESIPVKLDSTKQTQAQNLNWTLVGIVNDAYNVSPSGDPNGQLGEAFVAIDYLNGLRKMPVDFADRLSVYAYDKSPQALRLLQTQITGILSKAHLDNAQAETVQDLMQGYIDPLPTIYSLFYAVSILVALVGLLSLSHTIATSVLERQREIGILRSLGATGWRVGTVFFIEGLALALIAWLLGVIIGLPAGVGLVNLLNIYIGPLSITFHPQVLLTTLFFVIVIACGASFGPALSASRQRIQAIVRYE